MIDSLAVNDCSRFHAPNFGKERLLLVFLSKDGTQHMFFLPISIWKIYFIIFVIGKKRESKKRVRSMNELQTLAFKIRLFLFVFPRQSLEFLLLQASLFSSALQQADEIRFRVRG